MTLLEIARLAGVSIGTVDRVIHKRGRVSAETQKKVEQLLEKVEYTPNVLARHLKRARPYRISVLLPNLGDESLYWYDVYNGILQAKLELSIFNFDIIPHHFFRSDKKSLVSAFEQMQKSESDAWIIAPVMPDVLFDLLQNNPKTLPIVFLDSLLPGISADCTIAQDPQAGGILAARLMKMLSQSEGPFASLRPYRGAFNLDERLRSFRLSCKDSHITSSLDLVCSTLDTETIDDLIETLIKREKDIRGIFIPSSIGHMVGNYLLENNIKQDISVISWDLVEENLLALKKGALDCVIGQRPKEQGRMSLQYVYRYLILGEQGAEQKHIPMDIYFKENLPN